MMTWCMAHPWMTFFIIMFALKVFCVMTIAIADTIINHDLQDGENEAEEGEESENDK